MHDYQPKKNNRYYLPKTLYKRMIWLIRDYDRMKESWEGLLQVQTMQIGQIRSTDVIDSVAYAAIRREKLWIDIEAIDWAMEQIPTEYRKAIHRHICYDERFPDYADRKTWFAWQGRFLWHVANRLGLN